MARTATALEALLFVVVGVVPAAAQVDQALAEQYFMEAQALCERDGGRLWGISLCGPMVIADAATGTIATSRAGRDERFWRAALGSRGNDCGAGRSRRSAI